MNVKMIVGYRGTQAEATALLERGYGGVDPTVIGASPNATTLRAVFSSILVAQDLGLYRLFVFADGNNNLQALVEESNAWDLLPQTGLVWRRMKRALKALRPRLILADMATEGRHATILRGRAGFRQNVKTSDLIVGLGTILLVAVFVVLGSQTFDRGSWASLLGPAIPSTVTILYLILRAAVVGRSDDIQWEVVRHDR